MYPNDMDRLHQGLFSPCNLRVNERLGNKTNEYSRSCEKIRSPLKTPLDYLLRFHA